jgi:hypothetical protein
MACKAPGENRAWTEKERNKAERMYRKCKDSSALVNLSEQEKERAARAVVAVVIDVFGLDEIGRV